MEFSGERFVPLLDGTIALEHWHRYLLAKELVKGRDVLDIACGEGYGSFAMSDVAKSVVGVDLDQQAVDHACDNYQRDNLSFLQGDCASIPLPDGCVDCVVSFETLEHHDKHEEMLSEIKRVLRPGGIAVISTPDRLEYSDKPGFHNEFHVKELYRDEFESLIGRFFENQMIVGQRILYGSAIFGSSETPLLSFDVKEKSCHATLGMAHPVYLISVSSDGELPEVSNSFLEEPYLESEYVKQLTELILQERELASSELEKLRREIKLVDKLPYKALRGLYALFSGKSK